MLHLSPYAPLQERSTQHLCYLTNLSNWHSKTSDHSNIPLLPSALEIIYNRHSRAQVLLDDRNVGGKDGDADDGCLYLCLLCSTNLWAQHRNFFLGPLGPTHLQLCFMIMVMHWECETHTLLHYVGHWNGHLLDIFLVIQPPSCEIRCSCCVRRCMHKTSTLVSPYADSHFTPSTHHAYIKLTHHHK